MHEQNKEEGEGGGGGGGGGGRGCGGLHTPNSQDTPDDLMQICLDIAGRACLTSSTQDPNDCQGRVRG